MAKRKQSDTVPDIERTARKRPPKSSPAARDAEVEQQAQVRNDGTSPYTRRISPRQTGVQRAESDKEDGRAAHSCNVQENGKSSYSTPRKEKASRDTPSRRRRADLSAKRRSAHVLAERQDEDDWDGEDALAREILDEGDTATINGLDPDSDTIVVEIATPTATPSKRGRPKGSKNKRSPTPEGDIAPEERYFFQNRAGPPRVSTNSFSSVPWLTHDEYLEQIQAHQDDHQAEKAHLMKLHQRSFPQWDFELAEGFSLCLYGFGSKRQLVHQFAGWLSTQSRPPHIVVVNGYTPKLSIRDILDVVASVLTAESEGLRLVGQPPDMLDTLLSYLTDNPPARRLVVMVNSIDAPSIRRPATQTLLARLAEHPLIHFICTADTPTFSLLWNSTLMDQFKFVFHDCTTFAPYDAEVGVVDDVHELLGRKRRRAGGKDGIGFVLKSLPENARNLYRILLTEILAILTDGVDPPPQDDEAEAVPASSTPASRAPPEEVCVEYRTLYQKASEEFICSSDMNFRFLLKEFHDHQMITSRRDPSGTEVLAVPLTKQEVEAVLEDLVLG